MTDEDMPAIRAEADDAGRLVVVAHDGQVLPVPGGWDRDILERAAETLARHYIGEADGRR